MTQGDITKEISGFALIAAGSNAPSIWGSPADTVRHGITMVAETLEVSPGISRFYQTSAYPPGSGPDFVNAAFVIRTSLSPRGVLDLLHAVEAAALRKRDVRWGPRTLDLDLIGFDDAVLPDATTVQSWMALSEDRQRMAAPSDLILPHPRLQDRAFVLVPLADVASEWRHPVLGQTVQELCDALPEAEKGAVLPL
ncbi:MAG: 2-amino-4-hydroxy-6-hydroxymethyldihydropteridine diphosphokinase [Loktanella sp.]|nr:2-amino-4-hydroxy-6-hydroxymethyldihydropteridine diphosphokinase [Loktanella sp.]